MSTEEKSADEDLECGAPGNNTAGRSRCGQPGWSTSLVWRLLLVLLWTAPPAMAYERHINCGGGPYTSAVGAVYERDHRYTQIHGAGYKPGEGNPYPAGSIVSGTSDPYLFSTERWGISEYMFDVAPGTYTVTLDFAETWYGTAEGGGGIGSRVFHVDIEGIRKLTDLDIYAEAGAYNALSYTFDDVVVADGQLSIEFSPSVATPLVRAVSVLGPQDVTPPSSPSGLAATGSPFRAYLSWNAPADADIWGYIVERGDSEFGAYTRVNPSLVCTTAFCDVQVNNEREYFYRARAVDYSSNTGSPSSVASATPGHASPSRDFLEVPDCAWRSEFGYMPPSLENHCKDRGVALGGFGAGSFMYTVSGGFGPWSLDVAEYAEYWLNESAFHLYEKVGAGSARAVCLSTRDNMMSAWPRLSVGDATYYALQPRGWVTYDTPDTDVSVEFLSPVIPHNYRESSYPAAVFKWRLSNSNATDSVDVAIMLSWPNAIFHSQTRTGWTNFLVVAGGGGPAGIVLKASDPSNTPETQDSEWCIATLDSAGVDFSYVTSWDKYADGSDVWSDFADNGVLVNGAHDASQSAAAIAAKVTLGPGEIRTIPFAISWDFPVVQFDWGTEWWKRYCEYFDTDADNSFAIASEALYNYQQWEADIAAWQDLLITNNVLPDWLKCAAFNELYYSQFGGCFWESGLKSHSSEHTEYRGYHVDDHKNFVMECQSYRNASPIDVRHYNSVVFAMMWPEMERDLLINTADAIEVYDPVLHQTPHDVGTPERDPYFAYDAYGANGQQWKDLSSRFIQQSWRYYALHKDEAFLDYIWPAAKQTYAYLKSRDLDSDYIPNNIPGTDNTYDCWQGWGPGILGSSSLCAGLWVGALEAMEKMAIQQDDDLLPEIQVWLVNARSNMTAQLWNESAGYFQIDTGNAYPTNESLMADGLNGERLCQAYGLDPIVDSQYIRGTLEQVYDRCVIPLRDDTGDGVGDMGIMNGMLENGARYPTVPLGQATEVWGGSTYFLAAMMYHAGLEREALQAAYGIYYPVYEAEDLAYRFNVPEAWNWEGKWPRPTYPEQYQRIRAVWELVYEMVPDYPYSIPLPRSPVANVALAGSAAASSTEGVYEAPYCIDGNWMTRWSSAWSDPQWLAIDLGATFTVSRVSLHWEQASGKSYKIQTSSNGVTWADAAIVTNGNGGHDMIDIDPPARTRHIRMYGTERNMGYGYSLWEFEVYAHNLAQGKPLTASSSEAGHPPNLAADGRMETRWSSGHADDEWLQVDLGALYPVDALILHWEAAYASEYSLFCSTDGSMWTGVYTNTGDGGIDLVVLSSPAAARYVKFQGIDRATTYGYSPYEVQVFGRVADDDQDGLNDTWEMQQFGTLAWSGAEDPDCDGTINANEQMIASAPRTHPDDNDFDHDTMSNYEESLAGTDPRSGSSYLCLDSLGVSLVNDDWFDLTWSGVSGRTYRIYWLDRLTDSPWQAATPAGLYVDTTAEQTWTDDGTETGGISPGQATNRFYKLDVTR